MKPMQIEAPWLTIRVGAKQTILQGIHGSQHRPPMLRATAPGSGLKNDSQRSPIQTVCWDIVCWAPGAVGRQTNALGSSLDCEIPKWVPRDVSHDLGGGAPPPDPRGSGPLSRAHPPEALHKPPQASGAPWVPSPAAHVEGDGVQIWSPGESLPASPTHQTSLVGQAAGNPHEFRLCPCPWSQPTGDLRRILCMHSKIEKKVLKVQKKS